MLATCSVSGLNPVSVKWIRFWSCPESLMPSSLACFPTQQQRTWGCVCTTGRMCMGCVLAGVHAGAQGLPRGAQHIPWGHLSCPTTHTTLLNTVGTCFWVTLKLSGTLFPAVICKKASFLYHSYKN